MDQESATQKPFVSAFILTALFVAVLWLLPASDTRDKFVAPLRPFISYFGFWQTNQFFAPDPPKRNVDIRAEIHCSNGKTVAYQFPRLDEMGIFERIIKCPFRKYAYYVLDYEDQKHDARMVIRTEFAKFIARRHASPECTPTGVTISSYVADVPPPNIGLRAKPVPHTWHEKLIEYAVTPADLQ
jgi:hypothetical protein